MISNLIRDTAFISFWGDIPQGSKICIYGAGSRGQYFYKYLAKERPDVCVKFFVDSHQNGQQIGAIQVKNTDYLCSDSDYDFVVVASCGWQEILIDLHQRGIFDVKILSFHFATCLTSLEYSQNYTQSYFVNDPIKYNSLLRSVLDIFEEQEDKDLYKKLYDIRDGKFPFAALKENIPELTDILSQYVHFINRKDVKTMLDIGVYDASGLDMFFRAFPNLEKIYGVEPLKNIYCNSLNKIYDKNSLGKIEIFPIALSDSKSQMSIVANFHCSYLTEEDHPDAIKVEINTLDDFVIENDIPSIDFIKFDVENAEMQVLRGGIQVIKRYRPQLAVSIYHSTEHFFEIPLFLKDNLQNYTYRLFNYSMGLAETILYAIPNEKYHT